MSIDQDRERLAQKRNLDWIQRDLKATHIVTVCRPNLGKIRSDYFILGGLIPYNLAEEVLSGEHISDVIENVWAEPAAYAPPGESEIKYFRWGVDENVYGSEPLVIGRQFSKMKEDYLEISEEFRLFHNLYHDRKTDTYIKIDDAGNETTVVIVKPDEVQIRLKEIRQFLAIKEMYLSLLFEFNEYSEYSVEELGPSEFEQYGFRRKGAMCWTYNRWDIPVQNFQSISSLRGRKLIEPLPKSKSGFGDFAEDPKYTEFIVGVDENGDEVFYTCNPYKLKRISGENPDAPWDFTPVHFRKQVLDRYYNEPNKYNVKDSRVECGMWGMKIDNHNSDKVCVMLRDLGSLPYTEQLHWKSHNIPPEGGVSETFYRRMVKGERANSNQPDILFKQSYEQLQKACDEYLDWQLLKPLSSGDEYRLRRLRIPTVDEESHFKDLVLDLANLLIERLNERCLENLIPVKAREEVKRGINRLEYVLDSRKVKGAEKHITFLRCLWDLRNTRGGSHPEFLDDSRYKRASAHFNLENLNRQEAFAKILREAVEFLDFLIAVVRSGKLDDKNEKGC
ncbi:hypothetical protein C6500_04900 [Candidatus Poribacteria bacterium]|nr:MAG: hypothetical protein C6500_04900 [Candidatus Poribacteria bacterium]